MLPNTSFRKLVQISEQALPLVHVPLILGNDFFILTQQDVRKIEDNRSFSIYKVMPNGDLKTIINEDASVWLQELQKQENLLSTQNFRDSIFEFLISNRMSHIQQQSAPPVNVSEYQQPMEVSTTPCENSTVASIEQQLKWNKCINTSAPFPMKYSHGTSTTEIDYKQEIKDHQNMANCCSSKIHQDYKIVCNKSTNTQELKNKPNELLDAREQLKKKKIRYFFG